MMQPTGQRTWIGQALIVLVCVMLASQVGRLAYLHGVRASELLAYVEDQQTSRVKLPGRRGTIRDRHHRVLAGSHDLPTVFADPVLIQDHAAVARKLAEVLGEPADRVQAVLDERPQARYVVIRQGATKEIGEQVALLGIPGVGVHNDPVRRYPSGERAAHVLGFVGRDGEGLEGIEMTFERYLKAVAGKREVVRDVRRRAMFQTPDSYVAPRDGAHVVLTLDLVIQEVVEREVSRQVEHFKAESGVGLVMNPQTGEVLAMANVPTYDPAQGNRTSADVRRNRVLTDPVEPGSVFKPYTMVAALAAGLTRPDEVIYCEGGKFIIGGRVLRDHHAYGNLTVELVMAKSSNIGMAKLGLRLGNKRLYDAFKAFGLGGPTGIDLPGEDSGLLMPLRAWNSYTTTSVPMGQELAVTPIQIATAFSAVVNGGRLLQPRVVRAVIDTDGRMIEDRSEVIERGQAVDPAAAATMCDILVKVVVEGTGKQCDLDRWQVMGKTGTAQVPYKGRRGYEPGAYLGSFIAAAPASNPELVVLVMIRKPKAGIGYYGSVVALPAVRVILEESLNYLNIRPDKPLDRAVALDQQRR